MDCPMCGGNGELACHYCPDSGDDDRETQAECRTCHDSKNMPCPRCAGSGYLEVG